MPQHSVIVASDEPGARLAAWWASEIPACWPRSPEAVACRCMSLGEVAAELTNPESGGACRNTTVVLIVSGEGPRPQLLQVVDRLLGSRMPGLVLSDRPEALRAEVEPHGLLVESLSTDRAIIARTVHALSARQAAVDMLSTELRVARASQGGLSGEISRLHDELQLAGTVQRRFLPRRLPEIPGYEFGVLFRPCGYVSGDIYDIVPLDEHRTAFMLADAVGHGVPAALLTLVLGRALRQAEPQTGEPSALHSPSQTLARLNEELCIENEAGDRFATAVCAVVDAESGVITLASAGHPSPLVVEGDDGARTITAGQGPLLGVFAEAEFPETTLSLRAGETLVLYTDGFETAFPPDGPNPGRSVANEAYVGYFARAIGRAGMLPGGVQRALERVVLDLDAQSGSLHQRDDLTALALRRMPVAADGLAAIGTAKRAAA